MKSKIILFTVFICFGSQIIRSQNKNEKAAKVVFVIENKTNAIKSLELFNQDKSKVLLKKYPNSKFYLGLLKGEFGVKNDLVIPSKNASIIIYTNKEELPQNIFLPGDTFLLGDTFLPGDTFNLGHKFFINKIKLQVIERSQSQLVFKIL